MTGEEALIKFCNDNRFIDGAVALEDCYDDDWIYTRIGEKRIPFLPVLGQHDALMLHDLHHLVAGYDTSFRGEMEVAAWEIGSGGCANRYVFWIDRLFTATLGILLAPIACARAFLRGKQQCNLYRFDANTALRMELAGLRAHVNRAWRHT